MDIVVHAIGNLGVGGGCAVDAVAQAFGSLGGGGGGALDTVVQAIGNLGGGCGGVVGDAASDSPGGGALKLVCTAASDTRVRSLGGGGGGALKFDCTATSTFIAFMSVHAW